jgi:hypothetical protein
MARLGSPFDSPAMHEAYTAASYARLQMGLTYDTNSGNITCESQPYGDGTTLHASPGEVLSDPSVVDSLLVGNSDLPDIARMINIGFMLGALSQHVEDGGQ